MLIEIIVDKKIEHRRNIEKNSSDHAEFVEIDWKNKDKNHKNRKGQFTNNVKQQRDNDCFRKVLFYLNRFIMSRVFHVCQCFVSFRDCNRNI